MSERTEDLAIRQVLPITVGGETVELRTLTMDESDVWLRLLMETMDRPLGEPSDADGMAKMLATPADAAVDLIVAYDIDGTLGPKEDIRARISKREARSAIEVMAEAEDPFGPGARRLVESVFGGASQFLAGVLTTVTSVREASLSGVSVDGISNGETSAPDGAASASSSTGSAATSRNGRKRTRSAQSSRTR